MKQIRANGNQSGKPRESGADAVSKLFIGRIEGGFFVGFQTDFIAKGLGFGGFGGFWSLIE